jgi:hypothetical protein
LNQVNEALLAGEDIDPFDRLFHISIAAATRIAVLAAVVEQFRERTSPIHDGGPRRSSSVATFPLRQS